MVWLALLLALGTLVAIAYPLLRPRLRAAAPAPDPAAAELAAAKEATYSAIKELEFDYRAGSLSREDYQDLESGYKRKAAALLQREDAQRTEDDRRTQIEAEIQALRSRSTAADSIEEEIRRLRGLPAKPNMQHQAEPSGAGRFCTQCGSKADAGELFCAKCGHPLKPRSDTK